MIEDKSLIFAAEKVILKIVGWGIGGVLCLTGTIIMAIHTFLKLDYPDWLIAGLVSVLVGFVLIIFHTTLAFIIKIKEIKAGKNKNSKDAKDKSLSDCLM